ncbi:MAG TPA: putative toxin-antitoxin system toxin component, PIN family [Candidatus Saccharimonadales bacterium]|nr:putative toxin-antitoxin system toxin component, PIN family [Candidatus Saccharimonadales bacterium]
MRILYDSNVLVTILSRRESILAFKEEITSKGIIHISSRYILSEVEAVLVEKLRLTKQKAKTATRLLSRQSIVVDPKNIEKICRDPFDDYVLAAAVGGKAKYLVTADKDLLVLKAYKSVEIITPGEFRKIVED